MPVTGLRAPLAAGPGDVVYLVAPHGVTSGGPEAIHQLAAALQALGTDARVVYVRWLDGTVGLLDSLAPGGLPPAFAGYGTQESDSIEDSTHNVLILPEIWTQAIEEYQSHG